MTDAMPRVTANRTRPLPSALRRRLEAAFGAGLDGARLHTGPAAERIAREAGGLACALDGREIFLGRVPRRLRPFVLAHEAAHLVQQRQWWRGRRWWRVRRGCRASVPCTEAEADRAARAALAGRRFVPRRRLDPRDPACWAEAGHYYTAYLVHLAAGVESDAAFRSAFFCQLPDELAELDAVAAGVRNGSRLYGRYVGGLGPFVEIAPGYFGDDQAVQKGLHALTGTDAETASAKHAAILLSSKVPPASLDYGLALHAFGDTFSHRDGDKTYPPMIGHAGDMHEPDLFGPHRAALYERYVRLLYRVAIRKFGGRIGRMTDAAARHAGLASAQGYACRMSEEEFVTALADTLGYRTTRFETHEQETAIIIPAIRRFASERLGVTMQPYKPEEPGAKSLNPVYRNLDVRTYGEWQFRPILFPPGDVERAIALAEAWSTPGDGGGGTAEDVIERYPILP
jgi:hypothetical protein